MSNTTATIISKTFEGFYRPLSTPKRRYLLRFLWLPLIACLLVAVIVRVWLIVHTNGVIAGDEAEVGLQAEHILHGEHPIYYYGQPYMGSLEMYLIAGIIRLTGPFVWAARIEPLIISLILVSITWFFSRALADSAHLSPRVKMLFIVIATLVAAFAPLYDTVEELRTTGGYVEAFTIMLWMLYWAFRLTQRWHAGASARELALRWAGIGFLIGFGFWIDPLVVYALMTIIIWIGGYFILQLVKPDQQTGTHPRVTVLKEALLIVVAIPASLVGFAPGLYWGAHNQWANIHYLFQKEGILSSGRLHTILRIQDVYTSCLAPRALGGALPSQPDVTVANPHILTFGLVVSVGCILISVACVILSVILNHPLLLRIRQLTLLPLLFLACASVIFCTASISIYAIRSNCSSMDLAGRYVVPLVIALPFLIAAIFTIPAMVLDERKKIAAQGKDERQDNAQSAIPTSSPRLAQLAGIQAGLLVVLAMYFLSQGIAYIQADPRNTFQGTGCISANPTDQTSIINYMQHAKIRYAWAAGWLADPITFKTNAALLVTERPGRILANSNTVLHVDRPSIFFLVRSDNLHPKILHPLDVRHITYHIQRFYSEPGVDLLLVTPLNRTVSPLDPAFKQLFWDVFKGCPTQ
ncbi:MAG TPA: hypothetical protein VN954_05245 [Ktedonobacteraceae bacterium]|nr:hypothetical protein [Ktedonobacteraceae bacterium]